MSVSRPIRFTVKGIKDNKQIMVGNTHKVKSPNGTANSYIRPTSLFMITLVQKWLRKTKGNDMVNAAMVLVRIYFTISLFSLCL